MVWDVPNRTQSAKGVAGASRGGQGHAELRVRLARIHVPAIFTPGFPHISKATH